MININWFGRGILVIYLLLQFAIKTALVAQMESTNPTTHVMGSSVASITIRLTYLISCTANFPDRSAYWDNIKGFCVYNSSTCDPTYIYDFWKLQLFRAKDFVCKAFFKKILHKWIEATWKCKNKTKNLKKQYLNFTFKGSGIFYLISLAVVFSFFLIPKGQSITFDNVSEN